MQFITRIAIRGYPGYEIDETGVVYGLKGQPLKQFKRAEYLSVNLYRFGKGTLHTVHRLVAEHFVPNPDNLPEVDHDDDDKENNHKSNLVWCTCQYNSEKANCKRRYKAERDGEVHIVTNMVQFCKEHGLSKGTVWDVLSGKCKQHGGWTFEYVI
jgi:hypothetical protein